MKTYRFTFLTISILLAAASASAQMDNMPGMHHDNKPMQSMPNMSAPAKPAAQQPAATTSIRRDTLKLQESEAPDSHTGDNQPAPELLKEADANAPLTLQQLEDLATANNPTLKQATALQQRSQAQARQAALPPNPTIGYSGEHIRGGSYGGGEQGAFVQQTIVLGGKLGLRRDVYQQAAKADAIGIEQQTIRVRADVQSVFYQALAAQSAVEIRRQLMALAQNVTETSHTMQNLGQTDTPDVLQAEVENEQSKIDYVAAQRDYLQKFRSLTALCGQPNLPVAKLTGDLEAIPNLDTNETINNVLNNSPDIQRAQQEVAVAEAQRTSAKREPVPDLKIQAGAWNSGDQLSDPTKRAGWMGFAQIGVELPLWNRNQGNKAAAEADLTRAKNDVARTQLQSQQRAQPLVQSYLAARFEAERYRTQLLPRAQRAYELYAMKYQSMAAPYPQVLMSQRTLAQLRMAYLHALEKEWMGVIALQNYTLSGALDAPSSNGDAMLRSTMGGTQ
ncbi:outer membrane protein [Terriglobus roseus DSM 18391]|uniref:Outer membrane protein n=1 Tax=Terriglobus roseus (strain DSM 18391 / NRRL B-41598 / KBS 63) TaxID=926566 RepID=I3ZDX6_TERRK|nr:TolC family protein [Terriglobus roseus]AFL87444.1 outer membrane protein [Terriglobus roseus DSM 18391]